MSEQNDEHRMTIGDIEAKVRAERNALRAERDALRAELDAYVDAAQYDAMMDGPKFKGWNRSQLDRARAMTEARKADLLPAME